MNRNRIVHINYTYLSQFLGGGIKNEYFEFWKLDNKSIVIVLFQAAMCSHMLLDA